MAREAIQQFAQQIRQNVEEVIVGKRDVIDTLIIALLCEGHVLLEDVPGVGKTMLARALALSLDADFRRLQCTPDLLPSDITGVSIFNQETRQFQFIPGPAFTNILLADEINRATPRAQAALLECMGERQVTVDGVTRTLPRPFLVLATQNPVEYEGTFPLPEAQLDRFLFKTSLGYLSADEESRMLLNLGQHHPIETLNSVASGADIPGLAESVWTVRVDDSLREYIIRLVQATRKHPDLAIGLSAQFMSRLPIPDAPAAEREAIGNLAMAITEQARARYQLHRQSRHRIVSDLGASPSSGATYSRPERSRRVESASHLNQSHLNQKLTAWWELDFPTFRVELKKVFKRDIPLAERDEWEAWLRQQRAQHQQFTAEIIRLETELNERVYALFDLTPAEIKMIEASTKYQYGEV